MFSFHSVAQSIHKVKVDIFQILLHIIIFKISPRTAFKGHQNGGYQSHPLLALAHKDPEQDEQGKQFRCHSLNPRRFRNCCHSLNTLVLANRKYDNDCYPFLTCYRSVSNLPGHEFWNADISDSYISAVFQADILYTISE